MRRTKKLLQIIGKMQKSRILKIRILLYFTKVFLCDTKCQPYKKTQCQAGWPNKSITVHSVENKWLLVSTAPLPLPLPLNKPQAWVSALEGKILSLFLKEKAGNKNRNFHSWFKTIWSLFIQKPPVGARASDPGRLSAAKKASVSVCQTCIDVGCKIGTVVWWN